MDEPLGSDWGDIDSLPPPKSGTPKWLMFCGAGCLLAILMMIIAVALLVAMNT